MSYNRQIADVTFEAPAPERHDSAPAALRQWSRQMPYHEYSFEQSDAMRGAIDIVLATLSDDSAGTRTEIARLVLGIANEGDYSASALAKMAIDRMEYLERKTG
jgi:hypothetical protein